jgi:mannose-6-phosphate isomerase-like protein (cupin superfamily)
LRRQAVRKLKYVVCTATPARSAMSCIVARCPRSQNSAYAASSIRFRVRAAFSCRASLGPGRHVHTHEDEAVYVISGVLSFCIGDRRFDAGPQTLVWMPRQVPHVFANLSDEPVRTFGVITPSGLEGMFAEQSAYFATLTGEPDIPALHALSARYGVLPVEGPPLSPILRS